MPDLTPLSPAQVISWPRPAPKATTISGETVGVAPQDGQSQAEADFMQLARDRFKFAADSEDKRRREMLKDLKFRCGEQWDPEIRASREKGNVARPCLTINRIPGFTSHVVNNMRQARPAIKINPVGDADTDQAEVRQGLIRHIEVNSNADVAYDTAFENMCIMGLGVMRVVDDWVATDSFDKDLFVRWVPNTFSVYWDPTAQQPDWSDIKYAFIVEDLTRQEFIAQFGKDREAVSATSFKSTGDEQERWFPGGKIRIAEYFHIEQEKDVLCELPDGTAKYWSRLKAQPGYELVNYQDDDPHPTENLPPDIKQGEEYLEVHGVYAGRTREVMRPVVWWTLIDGVEKLRERKWQGQYIPLIPVIGNQIDVDGERLLMGMVRFAREPQMLYNYMYSSFVETVALAPRNQWIAEFRQIENYRALYERANVDPMAVLPYDMVVSESGQVAPPPQRQSALVDLAAFVQGLAMADQQLKSVFRIFDASLGQKGPQESSLAINARKIESDTATYDWGDNFIRALRSLGVVLNDLLEPYYNIPGRIQTILHDDERQEAVILNQEHKGPDGQMRKYDLSKGRYSVVVSTGPSYQTRRQESATSMIEIAKVFPQVLQLAGDIIVKELDWPGKDAIAARLSKALPPGIGDPDPNAPALPPGAQAQFVQMQTMIQQLSEALKQATDKALLEQMKQEYETFREAMKQQVAAAGDQLRAGTAQAQFLSDKIFSELDYVRGLLEKQTESGPPSGVTTPPPPAGAPPTPTLGTPPNSLVGGGPQQTMG